MEKIIYEFICLKEKVVIEIAGMLPNLDGADYRERKKYAEKALDGIIRKGDPFIYDCLVKEGESIARKIFEEELEKKVEEEVELN